MRRILLYALVLVNLLPVSGAQARDKFLDIQNIKTPGGITVWHVEDHSLPIIAVRFMFLESGTALDLENQQGLVRLLSNTMDEGAGKIDSQNFQKILTDDSITLRFSAGRDGFGGQLETLTRNRDKAFGLMKLAVTSPRFDNEPVERMKASNLARIRSSMSDPDWMAARLINDIAFQGHPYAMNSGGTLTTMATLEPGDLRKFQEQMLTKDRLIIAATGDIDAKALAGLVDYVFGSLPEKAPDKTVPDGTVANAGQTVLYKQDVPQTFIEISMPAFDRDDPDYFALKVMNYIFGGAGFGSRLMEEAREKRGLTYGIYSSIDNYRHMNTLGISTSTKNESAGEMLSVIKKQMKNMQKRKVTDKELADAKSYLIGSMPLALSSTEQIAGMVLTLQSEDLPIDYMDHYAEKISAVTPEDIQRVAERILDPDKMTTVIVGNPEGIKPTQTVTELPNVR